MKNPALDGKPVLLVEDEYLGARVGQEVLHDAGGGIVGPCARGGEARAAARAEPVDVAVLDVNIAGEMVFPVALALEARGTPFLFVTGYGRAALPADRADWDTCTKPFHARQLIDLLALKIRPH